MVGDDNRGHVDRPTIGANPAVGDGVELSCERALRDTGPTSSGRTDELS